jgi:hypothetical protein
MKGFPLRFIIDVTQFRTAGACDPYVSGLRPQF